MSSLTLYKEVSYKISREVTRSYSTSFSIAVSFFEPQIQKAIYAIYGFVRFADEIVDSFSQYNQEKLLLKFERDYYEAYEDNISLNPVLHAFQAVVKQYKIPDQLISAFLRSMKTDLYKQHYSSRQEINEYIYGSADVVGLMCLKVFANGNETLYEELKEPAMRLGSAFQKVNFLRDLGADLNILNRQYFPQMKGGIFDDQVKATIINEVEKDFSAAREGIGRIPRESRLPVMIAYYYYTRLLNKINHIPAAHLIGTRISISGTKKMILILKAIVVFRLRLI